jgi:hypothetical protein
MRAADIHFAIFARQIQKASCGKEVLWESQKTAFPQYLEIPQLQRDFHFPTTPAAAISFPKK